MKVCISCHLNLSERAGLWRCARPHRQPFGVVLGLSRFLAVSTAKERPIDLKPPLPNRVCCTPSGPVCGLGQWRAEIGRMRCGRGGGAAEGARGPARGLQRFGRDASATRSRATRRKSLLASCCLSPPLSALERVLITRPASFLELSACSYGEGTVSCVGLAERPLISPTSLAHLL